MFRYVRRVAPSRGDAGAVQPSDCPPCVPARRPRRPPLAHAPRAGRGPRRELPAGRFAVPQLCRDGRRDRQGGRGPHPTIVRKFSIGKSYQGRDIWAAKISDNVATDENEPEVLFDALHHAREHLTVEQALACCAG